MEISEDYILETSLTKTIRNCVIKIIILSTLVRLILASLLELGNDEVYYWTYALYPDLSHFDHPPMVGFLIQASTLDLILDNDFFIRLGPILLAAWNTWLIYKVGAKVKSETAGLYASLLYTSSIYCSIISGFAIIPDAPQIFFWLLCLYLTVDFLPAKKVDNALRLKMILFGCLAGLAMLSKYHSIFIWVGVFSFIVFYNRTWLKDYSLYLSMVLSLLVISPIIVWNYQNNFISYTFHSDRVAPAFQFRLDYFFSELVGQILYANPFNYYLIVSALIAVARRKLFMDIQMQRILLLNSLPLYFIFTGFSLYKSTLPHWTGPAFISLIIITSAYWADGLKMVKARIPFRMVFPAYFLSVVIVLAVYCINYSPFHFGKTSPVNTFGEYDFTQDLYGWKFIGDEFNAIVNREEANGYMPKGAGIISYRWFPGAHEDFYIAKPLGRALFLMGDISETHKYYWINQERGGPVQGKDYYHIAVSNYYQDPQLMFGNNFEKIEPIDTITIVRANSVMRYAFVYRMKNFKDGSR